MITDQVNTCEVGDAPDRYGRGIAPALESGPKYIIIEFIIDGFKWKESQPKGEEWKQEEKWYDQNVAPEVRVPDLGTKRKKKSNKEHVPVHVGELTVK